MEFKSLSELVQYVDKAFASKFYSGASVVRKGSLKIIASVVGGSLYMLMLLAKRIWKNRFVSTCGPEALDGFGAEYGIPHKAPLHAFGSLTVKLLNGSTSATIPADTYFVDPVTNLEYKTVAQATINATNNRVNVIAVGFGAEYNAEYGTEFEFRDATPDGLDNVAICYDPRGIYRGFAVDVVIDGETQKWGETAEEYRARLLERIQNPAHGGSVSDYIQWATRFDFVTNAYVKAGDPKANTVCVAVANFNDVNLVLSGSQLAEVAAYVTSDYRRPVGADVQVFNVKAVPVLFKAEITPYNPEVAESVSNAINRLASEMQPGEQMAVEDIKSYILANSMAKDIKSLKVMKNSAFVQNLELSFNGSTKTAEVIKAKPQIINGEF